MGRGCRRWWRVAAPPLLLLLSITARCLDRDVTRPWHTPVLSLQHSARELSARYRTDKIAPTYTPLWSYRELGAPSSHDKATHPFSRGSQGLGHTGAPGTSHSIQVTAGKTLVVAHVAVGLVTWLAQDGCLLFVRETWDGQP